MPAKSLKSLGGKVGAYRKWRGVTDRTEATEKARAAFNKRFEEFPDPESASRAYYAELALKSAQVRRRKAGS
jgi:hypothetical protein